MRINFTGQLVDEPEVRVGFIGCGSHSFRNIYPTFQFAPVTLAAVCDLRADKAEAFRRKFGAERAYTDHAQMLRDDSIDAVCIVTGYDESGRPRYPDLAIDCLRAGKHVWIEKPPAATCADVERIMQAAAAADRSVAVGFKKMFFPANEKARELASDPAFGEIAMATIQYPQYVPTVDEFRAYFDERRMVRNVVSFLDHLCHPVSLLLLLLGAPRTLTYERSKNGAGCALFTFDSGAIAQIALPSGMVRNGGMENTMLVSSLGGHITVRNNTLVTYHRNPPGQGYGNVPSFYTGGIGEASTVWEPEFSLGQLYNKGLFLLGYYGEINEFARAILDRRPLGKGTLEDAWHATAIFEAFAQGPGRTIALPRLPRS